MAKIHSPILRLVTGSELSHQQLDDNINSFIYSSSIEGTTLTFYQGTNSGSFTAYQTNYTVGDTTPDGTISGSAQITLLGFISESASGTVSGSSQIFALLSGSTLVSGSVLRPEGDDVVSGSVLRPEGDDVVSGSVLRPTGDDIVSGSLQIASITGSSITSAVINGDDGRKIDFTKGDNTTFSVTVDTGSGGGSTDYISNVSFTGGDLSFTGEGSAFNSTVDLGDLVSGSVLRPEGDDVVSGSVLRPTGDDVVSGSVLRPEGDGVVSGSSQIDHDTTTNFVANEHIDHTSVSITAGDGLSGGGDISSTRTIDVDATVLRTTGDDIVSGSVLRPEGDDVVSGSLQIADITGSVITGAAINGDDGRKIDFTKGDNSTFSVTVQTGSGGGGGDGYVSNVTFAAGDLSFTGEGSAFSSTVDLGDIVSGSVLRPEGDDVVSGSVLRPTGDDVVSSSAQISSYNTFLEKNGDGVFSSSAQIDHDQTTNFVAGEHFLQSNITTVGTVTAGNVTAILPDLTVSGSVLRPTGDDVVSGSVLRPEGDNVISGSASDVRTFLNVEDGADVTDTTNVTSAGALMDSEVTSLALIKGLTAAEISGSGDVRFKAINDATSSYLLNTTDTLTGDLTVTGTLTTNEIVSNIVSQSITLSTGSNTFGDQSSDKHEFTGSVDVQGDVTAHDYYGGWQGQVISASKVDIDVSGYIDGSGAANEFARFTDSNTLEGLTAAQTRTALNVEDGATADQTNAEIRAAVEAATDSNVFTDDDHTKLNGIEASADVTDATNVKANLPGGVPSGSAAQARAQIGAGTGDGTVDTSGSPVNDDFAKFTDSNTIEGRSYAEVRSDLGLGTIYSKNSTTSVTNGSTDIPDGNAVYDHVTTRLSGYVNKTGTPANQQLAIFTDSDTISGSTQLKMSTSAGTQGLVVGDDGKANLYLGNVISAASSDVGSRFHMNNQDFYFDFQGDSTQTVFFRDYDGSGGIHTRAQIHFNGALQGYVEAAGGFTTGGNISGSAGLFSGDVTANNFITTSDRDLKSNITPIKEGLETLKKFVSYEYKLKGQKDAGFIAQEVQETLPYAVHKSKDGYLAMNTKPIVAHIHKAILELDKRLTDIEDKLK